MGRIYVRWVEEDTDIAERFSWDMISEEMLEL